MLVHFKEQTRISFGYRMQFLENKEFDMGHAVAQLVEALCYKPDDRGFDSR
jgi:hypothetical protein